MTERDFYSKSPCTEADFIVQIVSPYESSGVWQFFPQLFGGLNRNSYLCNVNN